MKAPCGHWWRIAVACTLLLKAAPLCPRASAATPQDQSGIAQSTSAQTVLAVRIVGEDGRVLSESPANLPIQPQKQLNPDQVAESIRILYRSGDYADVRAVSTPA